jgi:hypothetical protein
MYACHKLAKTSQPPVTARVQWDSEVRVSSEPLDANTNTKSPSPSLRRATQWNALYSLPTERNNASVKRAVTALADCERRDDASLLDTE